MDHDDRTRPHVGINSAKEMLRLGVPRHRIVDGLVADFGLSREDAEATVAAAERHRAAR